MKHTIKKMMVTVLMTILVVVLFACTSQTIKDPHLERVENLLKQQEEHTKKLEQDIADREAELKRIQADIEKIKQDQKDEAEQLEERLNQIEFEMHFFRNKASFSFIQNQTLSGVLQMELPQTVQDVYFSKVEIEISHLLSKTYDETYVPKKIMVDELDNELTIDFDYHGIYEISYDILYQRDDKIRHARLKEIININDDHYNLVWIHATQPALLFATDLLTDKYNEGTTYVEIERARTFEFNKLPENSHKYPKVASASNGNYNQGQIPNFFDKVTYGNQKDFMLMWMQELAFANPDATFTIIGVDNVLNVVAGATLVGIPMNKLSFKIYTDGSFTTDMINKNYSTQESFDQLHQAFKKLLENNAKRENIKNIFDEKYSFAASKLSNFEYIVNDTESWTLDQELKNNLSSYNVTVLSTQAAFNQVRVANKLFELEFLLKTRWGESNEESMSSYFEGTPEKNLLILGTSPAGETTEVATYASFNAYIEYIVTTYGDTYKIFYKGHPSYPSNEERVDLFESKAIIELPNSIPVETLMLLYEDVYVGGYSGTSFQSSMENQTIFFFGNKTFVQGNNVLAQMMEQGIFNNTVFLSADEQGNIIVNP